MDITLAGLFVYLFVSDSFSSAELQIFSEELPVWYIKNGHFHVLQQHPALKKCAYALAKEVKYVALRVDELTGECQGLPSQWLDNQKIESGYAYAKRASLKEDFQPPVRVSEAGRLNWLIPGVFKEGSKLDMFISIGKPHDPLVFAIYVNTLWVAGGDYHEYAIAIKSQQSGNTVGFYEYEYVSPVQRIKDKSINPWPAAFSSDKVFKISVLANVDANITVLVENEELFTFKPINFVPMYELGMAVFEESWGSGPVFLHGVQITVE